jgi:hypothetical protein
VESIASSSAKARGTPGLMRKGFFIRAIGMELVRISDKNSVEIPGRFHRGQLQGGGAVQ